MDMHHIDDNFSKIEKLFQQFKEAVSRGNNDFAIWGFNQKIVVEFIDAINASNISKEMKDHADLIVEKVRYCLDKYRDKQPEEFSKLTYTSIIKLLKSIADKNQFEEIVGGHISDTQNRLRRKIINAYKNYRALNSADKWSFIEYAVKYTDFKRSDLEKYLFPEYAVSLDAKNKSNGDEFVVTDLDSKNIKYTDSIGMMENQDRLKEQLKIIDEVWKRQKTDAKPVISELLTRELLFELSKNNIFEAAVLILKNAEFSCKKMVNEFLSNSNYELPSQQDIGDKFGLTKSGASVKLKRFLNSLRK